MLCILTCNCILCVCLDDSMHRCIPVHHIQATKHPICVQPTCLLTSPSCWAPCTAAWAVERQALDSACVVVFAVDASGGDAVLVDVVFSLFVAVCLFLLLMSRFHIVLCFRWQACVVYFANASMCLFVQLVITNARRGMRWLVVFESQVLISPTASSAPRPCWEKTYLICRVHILQQRHVFIYRLTGLQI